MRFDRLGCGSQMRAAEAAGLGLGLWVGWDEAEPSWLDPSEAELTRSELGKKAEMT